MLLKVNNLIKLYKYPVLGKAAYRLVQLMGADIPRSVKIGKNVNFTHNAAGVVIHNSTVIEDDVKIYHGVTIGRADSYKDKNKFKLELEGFVIKRGARICAGACVLGKKGIIEVGEDAVVAANAVLLNSIGPKEIWGGVPAHLIGYRDDV